MSTLLLQVIHRSFWLCGALVAGTLAASLYTQNVGWAPGAGLAVLALAACLRPYEALLVLAGLGPLGAMIFVVLRATDQNLRFEEALALSFIAGFAVRRTFAPALPATLDWRYAAAMALATLAATSGIISVAILAREDPSFTFVQHLRAHAAELYLFETNPVTVTGLMIGGILLMLAAREVCAERAERREAVARMLAIGAAAAASFNLVRIVAVSLTREEPFTAFAVLIASLRVNVHHGDLNAAGSVFALAFLVAIGVARRSPWTGAICASLTAAGVWTSGSRSAMAACLLSGAAWWAWTKVRPGIASWRTAAAGMALISVIGLAGWAFYPRGRNSELALALQIRRSLARGAMDMAAAAPVFGVGMGRYYILSTNYTIAPHTAPRENAHNNFLQVLAELGIPGLLLFLFVIAAHLALAWRSARESPIAAGLLAGAAAYLITCIGGHPLLVPAAAFPFWLAVGVAGAFNVPAAAREPRLSRVLAPMFLVLALGVAAATPIRASRAAGAVDVANQTTGFSGWRRDESGVPFRYAGGRASFYVPASATMLQVPVRRGIAAGGQLDVRLLVDGREMDRLSVLHWKADWQALRAPLPKKHPAWRQVEGRQNDYYRVELLTIVDGRRTPVDAQREDHTGILRVAKPQFDQPGSVVPPIR